MVPLASAITISTALLIAAAAAKPGATVEARERQWVSRDAPDGRQPMVAFPASDFSTVIFTAVCEADTRELVLRYYGGSGLLPEATAHAVLHIGDLPLTTKRFAGFIEGRSRVSSFLIAELEKPGELLIDAPNDMGEPWYVGKATRLRNLILACR